MDSLTILDNATKMLAEVRNIDDAIQLIDLAEAARVYAKQVKLGLEAQNHAAEIKLRAQRRAGEILATMEKAKGAAGTMNGRDPSGGWRLQPPEDNAPTYDDLGIDKHDAHIWQTFAKVTEPEFKAQIEQLKDDNKELTTAGVYRATKNSIAKDGKTEQSIPTGKYRIIYADPPWQYGNTMPDYMGVQDDHYPTMPLKQICDLPVKDIAEDNAVLFLWVTSPILEESFQVIKAWGFEYKASFVWDKVKHVMGHYNSVRHEFLLVCVRGSCQPDTHKLFDSVLSIERTEHSRKPEEFRQIIDTLYTSGSKIELFSRRKYDGWNTYGNEPDLS